ncbi:hypothetical protein [Mycobacterium dioxanotrophicus]|uniref:hypothetical protein n=1 Tax=Mycobacterium dioxanotrophicus TaxID=482462 RepID=UPI000B3576E4|nr:hypothetical protein [Mycobacterium dioxanotrophicus]
MSDVVERAKAALEGVTPGPWTWDGDTFSDAAEHKCPHGTQWTDHGPDLVRGNEDGSAIEEYSADNDVITSGGYDASGLEIKTADAEFIAAARTLVPELVAEVERLRKITDIIDPDSVYREQRDQAWAECDAANAEVERLRAGGPWVEHVEFQRAMKLQRDGDCTCNTGPDTEGPDEFCPWHGREYRFLADELVRLAAEVERLQRTTMSDPQSRIAEILRDIPIPIAAEQFQPGFWRSCASWEQIIEKVATAIETAIHDTPHPFAPYTTVADAAIAAHMEALKADGYAVIHLPTVAHKGPEDTDAKFFRQVADRLEDRRSGYIGGSNVRAAVSKLLLAAADAAEAQR